MEILDEFKEYLDNEYLANGEQNTMKAYYSDIKQFLNFLKNILEKQLQISKGFM